MRHRTLQDWASIAEIAGGVAVVLSLIEQSQLKTREHLNFRIFEHAHYQYQKGTLEEAEWDRYARIVRTKCTSEPAQAMWGEASETFQPEFRRVVDEIFTDC